MKELASTAMGLVVLGQASFADTAQINGPISTNWLKITPSSITTISAMAGP